MLSLGTEFFFAFWMASYSVGLPAGIAAAGARGHLDVLDQLGEVLAAAGIDDAFLCLVVAHLEWPLMQVLPLSLLQSPINESTWRFMPYRTASGGDLLSAICVHSVAVSALKRTEIA